MSSYEKGASNAVVSADDIPMASELPWWKQTMLRRLYFWMPFLFLGSTTLGYDGSVLNGLQTMNSWQNCKSSTGYLC